jgi:hypothetical protein
MKNGRPQCRDIPDALFLSFVEAQSPHWTMLWDLSRHLHQHGITGVPVSDTEAPFHLVRAKASRLIGRGLLDGCDCGCRGDFVLTERGREYLAALR